MTKVKLLTQKEYAQHRGVSAVAVHKAIRAGRISLIGDKIDPSVADIQWANNTRVRASVRQPAAPQQKDVPASTAGSDDGADTSPGDSDYWKARSRREQAEASMAERKDAELAGELIRVTAVRAALANAYVTTREAILNIPARLAPKLAVESDPAAIQNLLHAEMHAALTHLASAPISVEGGAAAPEGAAP